MNELISDAILFLIGFATNVVGVAILIALTVVVYRVAWKIVSEIWKGIHPKSHQAFINLFKKSKK